ncbi:MAG: hypothetical protein ACK4GN_09980 [Runella sp.]
MKPSLLIFTFCLSTVLLAQPYPPVQVDVQKYPYVKYPFRLDVIEESPAPVIDKSHPDCTQNQSGFEGGYVVKQNGQYFLFVGEMTGTPHRAKMQIALWSSQDAVSWKRQKTILEGASARTVADDHSEVWMQQMIFNEKENRWNLIYIAYRAGDATKGEVPDLDHNGIVGRLRSTRPGREGIDADYERAGVIFQPSGESLNWEGQQGTDSFFTYQVNNKWYGIYGSRNHVPPSPWLVGLAEAPDLKGPYRRIKSHSPLPIERFFIENPMVSFFPNLGYVAIYDVGGYAYGNYPYHESNCIGYAFSRNGRDWLPGKPLKVQSDGPNNWASDLRTPFGLVAEGNNEFTVLYSARERNKSFWAIGKVKVKLTVQN